jgi:hypothetical protein
LGGAKTALHQEAASHSGSSKNVLELYRSYHANRQLPRPLVRVQHFDAHLTVKGVVGGPGRVESHLEGTGASLRVAEDQRPLSLELVEHVIADAIECQQSNHTKGHPIEDEVRSLARARALPSMHQGIEPLLNRHSQRAQNPMSSIEVLEVASRIFQQVDGRRRDTDYFAAACTRCESESQAPRNNKRHTTVTVTEPELQRARGGT